MSLPKAFLDNMEQLLGRDEYAEFLESYREPRYYGLRVNTLKISVDDFQKISPFKLEPIPWTRDGFYYEEGESPGRHPYYHAGLYYIQEPSAMLPGAVLDAQPGEWVLDLCAAPGGKTVQTAAGMGGKGLLVTNDISQDRVKALTKNVALCGIRNALVTNETPQKLSERFQNRFNRILVDAPCSGEGMFRKDEAAAKSWGTFSAAKCAGMQWDILENMDPMLKENGTLVYSTCTFTPEEDEKMISRFLNRYPHYSLVDIDKCGGIENGRPQWSDGNSALTRTARLWPHRLKGEGHFVALLYKGTEGNQTAHSVSEEETWAVMQEYNQKALGKESYEAFQSFIRISLHTQIPGYFQRINDSLYSLPVPCPDLRGVKVAKFGWYLGDFQRDRFEPSHAMMLALNREDLKITLDLPPDSQDVLRYLKGETLMLDSEKGWVGITVNGYTLGWAKQTGDMLKNHYPKGWRKMS